MKIAGGSDTLFNLKLMESISSCPSLTFLATNIFFQNKITDNLNFSGISITCLRGSLKVRQSIGSRLIIDWYIAVFDKSIYQNIKIVGLTSPNGEIIIIYEKFNPFPLNLFFKKLITYEFYANLILVAIFMYACLKGKIFSCPGHLKQHKKRHKNGNQN